MQNENDTGDNEPENENGLAEPTGEPTAEPAKGKSKAKPKGKGKNKIDGMPPAPKPGTLEQRVPGMIEPNEEWKDDLDPATLAALAGGPPVDHFADSLARFRAFTKTPMGAALCSVARRQVAVYVYGGPGVANGDPDNGGRPRIDVATGRALVTPECLGYKQRRFWENANRRPDGSPPWGYKNYQNRETANAIHRRAYRETGRPVADPHPFDIPAAALPFLEPGGAFGDLGLATAGVPPATFLLVGPKGGRVLVFTRDLTDAEQDALSAAIDVRLAGDAAAPAREFLHRVLASTDIDRVGNRAEAEHVGRYMCSLYADIRRRGAVLSSKINCGTFTGPLFISMGWSIAPLAGRDLDVVLTPGRIVNEADATKKDAEMGSRPYLGHALYRSEVHFSPGLATKTGMNPFDLFQCWDSLGLANGARSMWDEDRRSYRMMRPRALVVFSFPDQYGTASAESLLSRVVIRPRDGTPEGESPLDDDGYTGTIDLTGLPPGVTVSRLVWHWDADGRFVPEHEAARLLPPTVLGDAPKAP